MCFSELCSTDESLTEVTDLPKSEDEKLTESKVTSISELPDPSKQFIRDSEVLSSGGRPENKSLSALQNRSSDLSFHDESSSMSVTSQRTEMTSLSSDSEANNMLVSDTSMDATDMLGQLAAKKTQSDNHRQLHVPPVQTRTGLESVQDKLANQEACCSQECAQGVCHKHSQQEIDNLMQARTDVEELRECFSPDKGQERISIAKRLPGNLNYRLCVRSRVNNLQLINDSCGS